MELATISDKMFGTLTKFYVLPTPTPKNNVVWTAFSRIGTTGEQQQHCFGGGGVGLG